MTMTAMEMLGKLHVWKTEEGRKTCAHRMHMYAWKRIQEGGFAHRALGTRRHLFFSNSSFLFLSHSPFFFLFFFFVSSFVAHFLHRSVSWALYDRVDDMCVIADDSSSSAPTNTFLHTHTHTRIYIYNMELGALNEYATRT